jgi:hypothetical protein
VLGRETWAKNEALEAPQIGSFKTCLIAFTRFVDKNDAQAFG